MFFEMDHPDKCLTLNLDHEKYKTTVFEVPDKEAAEHDHGRAGFDVAIASKGPPGQLER